MPKPQAKFYEREVYGTKRIYPANEAAELFCKIAGTVTISKENLKLISQLGFETVHVRYPEIIQS